MSPSSQRAWIEILCSVNVGKLENVALLAEGVDRNILDIVDKDSLEHVALLAEGVDRNKRRIKPNVKIGSRPPRRGRG